MCAGVERGGVAGGVDFELDSFGTVVDYICSESKSINRESDIIIVLYSYVSNTAEKRKSAGVHL